MNLDQENVDTILCHAIEIETDEQRAAYLTEACGSDAELRSHIEQLIDDHFAAGSFLERPALGMTTDRPIHERPGDQIGPYKLLQVIGEGGMGVGWDQHEIRRRFRHNSGRRLAVEVVAPLRLADRDPARHRVFLTAEAIR